MTTTMTPVQSQNDFNQNEVPYFNEKSKERLLQSLSDNRKYEFLMFNLWKTRAVLFEIIQKDYDKGTETYKTGANEAWGDQFHAINDLIGVLLDGTDWNQNLFVDNPPKKRF